MIFAIGLKFVNRTMITVAMETGQNLPSAPPHSKSTLWHSIIATKRSSESCRATYQSLEYTISCSVLLYFAAILNHMRTVDLSLTNEKKTAVVPKG